MLFRAARRSKTVERSLGCDVEAVDEGVGEVGGDATLDEVFAREPGDLLVAAPRL